jgi:hypothetical protein
VQCLLCGCGWLLERWTKKEGAVSVGQDRYRSEEVPSTCNPLHCTISRDKLLATFVLLGSVSAAEYDTVPHVRSSCLLVLLSHMVFSACLMCFTTACDVD